MISLNQVYLLEQKVESAVAKIQQLQAENDALRSKCAELTNALSAKSEQLNTFESDQMQIEDGIKKALDRLNSIENSVLKTVSSMGSAGQSSSPVVRTAAVIEENPINQNNIIQNNKEQNSTVQNITPSYDTMIQITENSQEKATDSVFSQVPESNQTENFTDEDSADDFTGEEQNDDQADNGLSFDIF